MTTPTTRGLLLVHTGDGKGKTSAALNLVYRHLAHGKRAAVVHFVKNPDEFAYGDTIMLERLAQLGFPVTTTMVGGGYTWSTTSAAADRRLAGQAWDLAAAAINDPAVDLVVLDEIHIALHYRLLDLAPILAVIAARPAHTHVATTGRNAPEALHAAADLVTDFVAVKHPFSHGIRAQAGIEW